MKTKEPLFLQFQRSITDRQMDGRRDDAETIFCVTLHMHYAQKTIVRAEWQIYNLGLILHKSKIVCQKYTSFKMTKKLGKRANARNFHK